MDSEASLTFSCREFCARISSSASKMSISEAQTQRQNILAVEDSGNTQGKLKCVFAAKAVGNQGEGGVFATKGKGNTQGIVLSHEGQCKQSERVQCVVIPILESMVLFSS